ncbi:MAG: hypothetical protein N2C14_29060, partial [Planctomycetales bacterium]
SPRPGRGSQLSLPPRRWVHPARCTTWPVTRVVVLVQPRCLACEDSCTVRDHRVSPCSTGQNVRDTHALAAIQTPTGMIRRIRRQTR